MVVSISDVLARPAPDAGDDELAVRAMVYAGLGVDARPVRLGRYRIDRERHREILTELAGRRT